MYKYNDYNKKRNKNGGNIFELNNPKRLSDVEHSIYPFGLG